jgi:hypothetical protein
MTTLFAATLALARKLMNVHEGTVTTGASATQFADSAQPEAVDYYIGGTLWFTGPTPTVNTGLNVGKCREILTFTGTVFTYATTTALTAVNDTYAAADNLYPLGQLRQFINQALESIGAMDASDITLVTVANQEEYAYPTGVTNPIKVEIATSLTSPYEYQEIAGWDLIPSASKIRFRDGSAPSQAGYILRVTHIPAYTQLTTDAAVISDAIHPDLLLWKARAEALRWRMAQIGGDDKDLLRLLNEAVSKDLEMSMLHPVKRALKSAAMGGYSETPGDW